MANGEDIAKFLALTPKKQNLWLFQELQIVKVALVDLTDTAKQNGRSMWKIGLLIFGAVLSAAIGVWVKG